MIITIALMALVTTLLRSGPVTVIGHRSLPVSIERSLKYIPPSILSVVLVSQLLMKNGNIYFDFKSVLLWVTVVAFFIAYQTRSLFSTIGFGVITMAALRFMFPGI
jgi:branched-subunit amino acid transport protein